jgi:hypothetical protein
VPWSSDRGVSRNFLRGGFKIFLYEPKILGELGLFFPKTLGQIEEIFPKREPFQAHISKDNFLIAHFC